MRLLLADVLFCCWVIFGLLVFSGFWAYCHTPQQQGAERVRNIPYREGAERLRNIPYRESAQRVKMPLHIPLKALWGQNRDGGDEVRLGLQPLRGC